MAFNSVLFLFAFLPLVLILHRTAPCGWRNPLLLGASTLFYAFGEPVFVFIVAGSCLFDWLLGWAMSQWPCPWVRRACLVANVASNLGILFSVKYAGFAAANLAIVLAPVGLSLGSIAIVLPIGISFIVFEKISYIVDIYRGIGRPASLLNYFLFVFLFPKIMAGPIVKYHDIAQQLSHPRFSTTGKAEGLARFVVGLAKKVLIADTMAEGVNTIFALPTVDLGFTTAWLGALCFSVQIFFDFSGYSDMAIGLARVFGFDLLENFRQPYRARNFTEFWRRWHISLSTWIRDYLYIPLGGSRVRAGRLYANLFLCFLASGLWHGANWTFVAWGLYHGTFIVLNRISAGLALPRLPAPVSTILTFLLITLGWVVFRCPSFNQAIGMLHAMLDPTLLGASTAQSALGTDVYFFLLVGLALSFTPEDVTQYLVQLGCRPSALSAGIRGTGLALLLVLCFGRTVTATFSPFIYFRF